MKEHLFGLYKFWKTLDFFGSFENEIKRPFINCIFIFLLFLNFCVALFDPFIHSIWIAFFINLIIYFLDIIFFLDESICKIGIRKKADGFYYLRGKNHIGIWHWIDDTTEKGAYFDSRYYKTSFINEARKSAKDILTKRNIEIQRAFNKWAFKNNYKTIEIN